MRRVCYEKMFFSCLLIFVLGSVPLIKGVALAAETPSVEEIIKQTNQASYYQGESGRALVTMTITDSQGRQRVRAFTILRKDLDKASSSRQAQDGEQRFYIYFYRPADVKKMVFMVWKHLKQDDDRWLYLPDLDLVKRIAASDERTSFVGSNFFYEDVSGRGIEDDDHELTQTTDSYYVLRNTPKDPSSVEFSYFIMWVHNKTYLPIKIEYFDKNGEPYRVYEALKVEVIEGFPTVVQSRMKDSRTKGETVLEYSHVKYNIGIPGTIFTERYLRNPPRKYLK